MSDEENNGPETASGQPPPQYKPSFTPEQQAWLDKRFAEERRAGRNAERRATEDAKALDARVNAAVDARIAAMGLQQKPATPVVAAPSAPTGPVWPMTHQGLVDPLQLTGAQLDQLGPSGVRRLHEESLRIAREQQGTPNRPVPGKKAGR